MPRCAVPTALLACAFVADGNGSHSLAYYLVLATIPVVAVVALACFGELVEGSADSEAGALYVGLSALALVLLLIATAVRSNAPDPASVPPLGVSAAVGALGLLALQLVVRAWLRVARYGLVTVERTTGASR